MNKVCAHVKRHYLKITIITGLIYLTLSFSDKQIFLYFPERFSFSNRTVDSSYYSDIENMIDGSQEVSEDNLILIEYIKKQLDPPALVDKPLNLAKPIHKGQIGQVEEVLEYFQGKKNGFFIEAGAWDGEYLSNTLYLEVTANWTGLLVEPNIGAYTTLLSRNRKAHSIHSCLAVEKHPSKVEFDAADVFGGINKDLDKVDAENLKRMRDSIPSNMRSKYPVRCFPLYSLILAMGSPRVDFLSIDIEGAELAVLKTIPWEKVEIELVMLEVEHSDREALAEIMTKAGYSQWKNLQNQDIIYKKN